MKIKDDFSEKDSVLSIPPDWFNTVARFYNYLTGVGCVVEKPSDASENNPPVIKVPLSEWSGGASLSDSTPVKDGTGHAGSSAEASRANHVHPVNTGESAPPTVGTANAAGSSAIYAKADHAHKDRHPSSPASGSRTDFISTSEGSASNNGTTWTSGGTQGVRVSQVTRVRYGDGDSTPVLTCYYRVFTYDLYGRLYSVSSEGSYTIDQPSVLTV